MPPMKSPVKSVRVQRHSVEPVVRLPSSRFTHENSADSNRVFLWTVRDEPPFMHPVAGWRIVGYGDPPWPKGDTKLAVMFEKTTPAEKYSIVSGADEPEGTRIWQHGREEWVPGQPGYEGRMRKANDLDEPRPAGPASK